MAKLVSKTYGDALFDLAVENGLLDDILEEAKAVGAAFSDNPELLKVLTHPKVTPEEKIELVDSIFKGRVSEIMLGFLITVGNKNRYSSIEEILVYFEGRAKEYKKIGVVSVVSAREMTEEMKSELEDKLLKTTKYESLEIAYHTDETLLGGMIIRIGDRVVDSSIRTKLANMAKDLSRIQLAK